MGEREGGGKGGEGVVVEDIFADLGVVATCFALTVSMSSDEMRRMG